MRNLNSVLIEGVLSGDPEIQTSGNGKPVCNFQIASGHRYRRGGEVREDQSLFAAVAWGKVAEDVRGFGRKGVPLRVLGHLKEDRWTDKNGKEHSKTVIVAERVDIYAPPETEEQPALKRKAAETEQAMAA